jgi:hypothetical protein
MAYAQPSDKARLQAFLDAPPETSDAKKRGSLNTNEGKEDDRRKAISSIYRKSTGNIIKADELLQIQKKEEKEREKQEKEREKQEKEREKEEKKEKEKEEKKIKKAEKEREKEHNKEEKKSSSLSTSASRFLPTPPSILNSNSPKPRPESAFVQQDAFRKVLNELQTQKKKDDKATTPEPPRKKL